MQRLQAAAAAAGRTSGAQLVVSGVFAFVLLVVIVGANLGRRVNLNETRDERLIFVPRQLQVSQVDTLKELPLAPHFAQERKDDDDDDDGVQFE